jgi:spoIIIJ-associated protein
VSYEYAETPAEKAEPCQKGLLERMGSDAVPEVEDRGDGRLYIRLTGEKLGMLIGRHGETLDAIQHLTGYAVNRGANKRVHVNVDAEDYWAKREESMKSLAYKVAAKVIKYRKNMTLEPMNSYERHVIHTALQDYEEVSTYSTGSEPNRRVVVAYGKARRGDKKAE